MTRLVAVVLAVLLAGCSKGSELNEPVYRILPEALAAVRPGDVRSAGYSCEYLGTGIAIHTGSIFTSLTDEIEKVVRNMGAMGTTCTIWVVAPARTSSCTIVPTSRGISTGPDCA